MSDSAKLAHTIVLAGDVGGTNTTLALVGVDSTSTAQAQFQLLDRTVLKSQQLNGIGQAIDQARNSLDTELWQRIDACCLCAAGPISNNRCTLTNLPWQIDGGEVAAELAVPTILINDFSGICYGIPILFRQAPQQFAAIPHSDGSTPAGAGSVIAVVGAGTGLGVGYLTTLPDGNVTAHPSEGGHSDFAPFDDQTMALRAFVAGQHQGVPDAECFLSGPGIANLFDFLVEHETWQQSSARQRILAQPRAERPEMIAANAAEDPLCSATMELFVRIYAKFSSSATLHFLADGGLFLAGGIAAKNQRLFLQQHRFMRYFEQNYRANIERLLRRVPVHIVGDYTVSLYGAAYAAVRQYQNRPTSEEQLS